MEEGLGVLYVPVQNLDYSGGPRCDRGIFGDRWWVQVLLKEVSTVLTSGSPNFDTLRGGEGRGLPDPKRIRHKVCLRRRPSPLGPRGIRRGLTRLCDTYTDTLILYATLFLFSERPLCSRNLDIELIEQ